METVTAENKRVNWRTRNGVPNVTDDKKATILAKKNLQLFTQKTIADDENVSRFTVNQIKPENVSPEVNQLAEQKFKTLAENIGRVRDKALNVIEEHLDNRTMPAGSLPAIYGVLYDKHRLETGQSTVNLAVNSYAQTIINWAQNSNKSKDEIEPKLQAIADANGLNLAELRAAVFGSQSE